MEICGYVNMCDTKTNRRDIMNIVAYNCRDISMINSFVKGCSFSVNRITSEILNKKPDFSFVSYTFLQELIAEVALLDKKNEYPCNFEFKTDIYGEIKLKAKITKEIFPFPYKTDIGSGRKILYINISEKLFSSDHTEELRSSLLAHHLNFIALRNGYVEDRLFTSVCGRLFMNALYLSRSVQGISLIENLFPSYADKSILNYVSHFPVKLKIKSYKTNLADIGGNDEYINPFLKILNYAVRSVPDVSLSSALYNPCVLNDIVEAELDEFMPHLNNLLWQGAVSGINDFNYVKIDDLLCVNTSRGRDMMKYHIENNRKFYNCNKSYTIVAVKANGELIFGI